MAKNVKDSFLDLEKHRQLLEENIEKLRKSLLHWQIWEFEYEYLKEEILSVGPEASNERLLAIGQDFYGKLVTQAEVEDILGIKISRSTDQIKNVLSRRIEYVSQNVKTLAKQLQTAENKLAAATVISNPEVRNEEGLPMTDIIEELDEDGNVITSRTEIQGSARGQLLEVLEKAGVTDLPEAHRESNFDKPSTEYGISEIINDAEAPSRPIMPEISKKSVQYVDGTKEGPETHKSPAAQRVKDLTDAIKRNNSIPKEVPVILPNESAADAALRKEMLEYGMSEVGAVVAELDLEDGSDFSDDAEFDDYDTSSTEDDEDEFGRSTRSIVDDEMHQQMTELEQKLGLRMMENVGPHPTAGALNDSISETDEVRLNGKTAEVEKEKNVRFAETLDIAGSPLVDPKANLERRSPSMLPSPFRNIVEHVTSIKDRETIPMPTQKVSRFKSARATDPPGRLSEDNHYSRNRVILDRTASRPIADTIIERQISESTPLEPDELDPALLHQEAAAEYHRMRNRLIQRQGGFMKDLELQDGILPLLEEEGGPKKMSRFKAARLAKV